MMRSLFAASLAALTWFAGCSNATAPTGPGKAEVPTAGGSGSDDIELGDVVLPEQSEPGSTFADASTPANVSHETIPLHVTDWKGVEKLVAKNQGKVVVVDIWSTACPPCRAEFPNLVTLHRELGNQVACLSVSTDYEGISGKPVETYRPQVEKFLREQHATFDNVLCSTDPFQFFDEQSLGSIPAVYVYDRDGTLAKRFTGLNDQGHEHTYAADIRPFVEQLIAAP